MLPLDSQSENTDRVIVADDDGRERARMCELLRDRDRFDVHEASDWDALRLLVEEEPFDVVVIGNRFASVSGIETGERLRAVHDDPPALVLVGPNNIASAIKAFRCGFADYLPKEGVGKRELQGAVGRAGKAIRQKRAQRARMARLEGLTQKDALTGLPNHPYLREQIERLIRVGGRHGTQFAILAVRIRDLDAVYAAYGSKVGDQVVRAFAARLRDAARESDILGQSERDRFLYLVDRFNHEEEIGTMCQRLADSTEFLLNLDSLGIFLSGDVSAALYPGDGTTPEELLGAIEASWPKRPATEHTIDGAMNVGAAGDGEAERPAAAVARESDRRTAHRYRVLKRGVLILNDGFSTIDCVIRDISDGGARVAVEGQFNAPKFMELLMVEKNERLAAETRWQKGNHLGLKFVSA